MNRQSVKTQRDSRSHISFKIQKSKKITPKNSKVEKRVFETRIRIGNQSKLSELAATTLLQYKKNEKQTKNRLSKLESESKSSQDKTR